MRSQPLSVLALALLACRPTTTDTQLVKPDRGASSTKPEPEPQLAAPDGCVVRALVPSEAQVGSYPSMEVSVSPEIRYYGGAARPQLAMRVTKPDGSHTTTALELLHQPVCAYCLPTTGSSGCDHDCRWEPFGGSTYGLARELDQAGDWLIELALVNYDCALDGAHHIVHVRDRA